jgi:ABC-type transporter Mla subunit MlaD
MSNTGSTKSNAPGQRATANRSAGNSSPADDIIQQADDLVGQGKDAASGLTSVAQDAAEELKRSAALLARDGSEKLTDALSKQLSTGAGFFEEASESLRAAAAELDDALPPVAHALRTAASRSDDLAEQIRTKSLGELLEAGSNYARQNPLLVFGAAAGVGMLLSRFAKSGGQISAAPRAGSGPSGQGGTQRTVQTRPGQHPGRSQAANL